MGVNTMKKITILAVMVIVFSLLPYGCALVGPQAEVTITGQTDEGSAGDYYK
jgi:hypothetical protein